MAIREPLEYSGSLDSYARIEHTPIIGTEFPDLQVVDILDDDEKLRDLAIIGKLFFHGQILGFGCLIITMIQCPNDAWSSCETRILILSSRRSWLKGLASLLASQALPR